MRPFLWLAGFDWLPTAFHIRTDRSRFHPHCSCATYRYGYGAARVKPNGVAHNDEGCANRNCNSFPNCNHRCVAGYADNGSRSNR